MKNRKKEYYDRNNEFSFKAVFYSLIGFVLIIAFLWVKNF